ncbi:hypothetical protein SAMN05660772_00994 [Pasteurella testudinis DSM 23072]|uniref:Uncharacterized protein n=1 Tax=Pasteurella testudinis DSM 23072 TaxID=1122938 RepID=A0A1W1V2H3_9PAST|nr:hypothetical protein [Pasteurella testudinis]SMB87523.1 hypothetical protein SAMN05660772_00994 [Pasteurella testudinis DSM 23072]SUB50525.1 Uncharacterised protein [Pasteurella testudinis]
MNFERLEGIIERLQAERERIRSQVIAIAGKPDTIQNETLKHQITVALWHLQEQRGLLNLLLREVAE